VCANVLLRLADGKSETEGKINIVICYGSRALGSDGREGKNKSTRKEKAPRPGRSRMA
jgi:hypothetical protein